MYDPETIQAQVFQHMLQTRGPKYKWFLRALRSFKFVSLSPTRGSLMESYYTLMRYVDDVVDGDAPLPERYSSREHYVLDKIAFSQNPRVPSDPAETLMVRSYELADRLGIDISEETDDILNSMLFDARRVGKSTLFTREDLEHHFHTLDVRGTIRGALKLFKEDPDEYLALEPLGLASRVYYNLRDYEEDIEAGLVNIPSEDIDLLGIDLDRTTRHSPSVGEWFVQESQRGLELLAQYHQNVAHCSLGRLARLTAPVVYETPARKYFNQVLEL